MDHVTFDRLTRRLGTTTRRSGLGLALGAAGGALAGFLVPDEPDALGKGKNRNRKKRKKQQSKQACPEASTDCGGGVCAPAGECCPGEKTCGGGCIRAGECCPHTERACTEGGCVAKDACCPILEEACGAECCSLGEACSDDGCCPVNETSDVCGGKCTDLDTNDHCGACGNACGACQTCRSVNGRHVCAGPDRSAPACEDCLEGQVVQAVSCGSHCCGIGAECCGGGCCASGRCRVVNGQSCCLKVVDNIPVCQVM